MRIWFIIKINYLQGNTNPTRRMERPRVNAATEQAAHAPNPSDVPVPDVEEIDDDPINFFSQRETD